MMIKYKILKHATLIKRKKTLVHQSRAALQWFTQPMQRPVLFVMNKKESWEAARWMKSILLAALGLSHLFPQGLLAIQAS